MNVSQRSMTSTLLKVVFASTCVGALAAAAGACAGAPATPPGVSSEPVGSHSEPMADLGSTSDLRGDQFDDGTYNLNAGDTLKGTLYVNNSSTKSKELWVLDASCGASNCDVSGLAIKRVENSETFAEWAVRAARILNAKVYGAAYDSDTMSCGANCTYSAGVPSHSFSLLPKGRYAKVGDLRPRVFVQPDVDGGVREYWIMNGFIGDTADGGVVLALSADAGSLSDFACGACGDAGSLGIYKVTYTLKTSIDCADVDACPDAG